MYAHTSTVGKMTFFTCFLVQASTFEYKWPQQAVGRQMKTKWPNFKLPSSVDSTYNVESVYKEEEEGFF